MKNIVWIIDVPGWAYDANIKKISQNLPQYSHQIIYGIHGIAEESIKKADIIINVLPHYLYRCKSYFNKTVIIIDSIRAWTDKDYSLFNQMKGIICCNDYIYKKTLLYTNKGILQTNGVSLSEYFPKKVENKETFTFGFAGNIKGTGGDYKGWSIYQQALLAIPQASQHNAIYEQSQISLDRMVPDFYHKIDCLVLLSDGEGCSNVIMEALACGVPVITTKVGYHGEFLTHKKECFFVLKEAKEASKAMREIMNNKELYLEMKRNARRFAIKNHNIEQVAEAYSSLFEK